MNSTTLFAKNPNINPTVFDIGGLLRRLATLRDTRGAKGRRYALAPLLLLVVLAKLSDQDTPSEIADWIKNRADVLLEALCLPWKSMPHHNTYRRIAEGVVSPDELDRTVKEHMESLPGVGQSILTPSMARRFGAPSMRKIHEASIYWPPICQKKESC